MATNFEWRGRYWALRPATPLERTTFAKNSSGMVYEDQGLIVYDDTLPEDLQIQTILHEIGHVMFPEWEAEPHNTSCSELGVFERDLPAFLIAFGIDLSPLLEQDED